MQCTAMQQGVGIISQVKLGRMVVNAKDWMRVGGGRWLIHRFLGTQWVGGSNGRHLSARRGRKWAAGLEGWREGGSPGCRADSEFPYRTVLIPREAAGWHPD